MFKHTTSQQYPDYPRIDARIGENPARWLHACGGGVTPTVRSLLDGMTSAERACNWRYVAEDLNSPAAVRNAIDARIDHLQQRQQSYHAQAHLRAVYHAAPDERPTIIEHVAANDRGHAQVVAALANQLNTQPTDESSSAADAAADSTSTDLSIERAREIAANLSHDRAVELLAMERNKDQPREAILQALDERTTNPAETASPTDDASPEVAADV